MSPTLIIFVVFVLVIYVWIKNYFNYWTDKGFPQINGTFPFGSLFGVGFKMCMVEKYDSFYKNFKGKSPFVGFYNFLTPAVLVIDTEMVKTVLVSEYSSFHTRGLFYNKKDDPISVNLLTLGGQEWKDRRQKLTTMFSTGKIKSMFEIVDTIGDQLVDGLMKNISLEEDQDMKKWAQRYSNDTIGNVAFGLEFSCLQNEDSDFLKYGKRIFHLKPHEVLKTLFASDFPELGRKLGLRFTAKDVGDFFMRTFLETLEYREKNKISRNDFVSLLLNMKDTYDPTELAAEALLIYMGGYETSSTLISYILYELALNQDLQERLREEIVSSFEENNDKFTYDSIRNLKYLDMVINEGLRKYPPGTLLFRKCTKDIFIPKVNVSISKGTPIVINSYSFHHDPEYFPNPELFDPERFNDDNLKNIKPFTYFPFGEGPRQCIGTRLGQMQSKIAVVKMIKNFKFHPCQKTAIPVKLCPSSIFIDPQDGIWLKIEKIL